MSNIDLSLPSVEIREIRLNSLTSYSGQASDLVKKAQVRQLKDEPRHFMQCSGCSITKAACMAVLIQDAVVVEHGPIGCSTCLHSFDFTYLNNGKQRGLESPSQRRIFSTNVQEKDTVYGGAEKLRKTIIDAHKRTDAKAVFVLSTCATAIVGDDI